jgi:hypothetical protein
MIYTLVRVQPRVEKSSQGHIGSRNKKEGGRKGAKPLVYTVQRSENYCKQNARIGPRPLLSIEKHGPESDFP